MFKSHRNSRINFFLYRLAQQAYVVVHSLTKKKKRNVIGWYVIDFNT